MTALAVPMPAAATAPAPLPAPSHVYAMSMFNERLQILVSKEQRRRLEREAKRRGSSVASVIREAIDERLGRVANEDRAAAVEAIAAMRGVPFIPPDELGRLIDETHAAEVEHGLPLEPPR